MAREYKQYVKDELEHHLSERLALKRELEMVEAWIKHNERLLEKLAGLVCTAGEHETR